MLRAIYQQACGAYTTYPQFVLAGEPELCDWLARATYPHYHLIFS
jgi:hypothetical protein